MCCRYYIEETTEMQAIVSDMMRSSLVRKWNELYPIKTYGEMSPTDIVPVIAPNRNRQRAVFPMKWGFTGKTLLMNARVETAAVKPTFRDAWKSHRCIVPASYYFEWEHLIGNNGKTKTGDKYAIQPQGSSMTWLCGLYRFENDMPFFVILTREPGKQIRFIHDRMPLIMPEHLVNEWINPDADPEELIREAVTDVVAEKAG
ncbi:MAG: SOS response-associated peptidase family protein [Eubacterium sp.]|nr:SOS response-associated peptidase family protein [Eubacterium sp.]